MTSGSCETRPFPVADLNGHPADVAPRLLEALLICGGRVGRIIEVEAYGGADDPASHAHRRRTQRNSSMFEAPGTLYVYRSYGIHWCANVVCDRVGEAGAVLIRAVEPLAGIEEMRQARPRARRDVDLANGPGKLCAALAITDDDDGTDVLSATSRVRLRRDHRLPPDRPPASPRIGISAATDRLWRYTVRDHGGLSR